jgi:hypothetical protein
VVDLFKRMFGKDTSKNHQTAASASVPVAAKGPPSQKVPQAAASQPLQDEARLAARRAQIANDLFELQQIAMAELALRKEQDAAASKAGFEAEDQEPRSRALIV